LEEAALKVSIVLERASTLIKVGVTALSIVACQSAMAASNDYLWLHVDGKYIKTSPSANPPNQIFVAAGVAIDQESGATSRSADADAAYVKGKGCNIVRFSINTLPKPQGCNTTYGTCANAITQFIDPHVQSFKSHQLYVFFDQHEYFHSYNSGDSWMPNGAVWDSTQIQAWINDWVTLATKYKDEPWVAGYELCNEPKSIGAAVIRQAYTKCIQAIRKVDAKHIIFLGNDNYTHAMNMKEVWGAVSFKPDTLYNQVVFSFHEYTNAYDPSVVAPVLDTIQNTYNVPVFCTEFGPDITVGSPSAAQRQQFETDMFAMFKPRHIGWTIWHYMGGNGPDYTAAWLPAVTDQASPIPLAGTLVKSAKQRVSSSTPAVSNSLTYGISGRLLKNSPSSKKDALKVHCREVAPNGPNIDLQK
jgi:Cellulase (glycosyl hydrolase family 5)